MKIKKFLTDRIAFLFAIIFIIVFNLLMFRVFNLNIYLAVIIITVNVMAMGAILVLEYLKKWRFYSDIESNLEGLDKKYLLSELVKRPGFTEGQVFYDALKASNKSMNDEILKYNLLSEEYKEYIETWVHEVKTPIASSKLIIENNKSEVTQSLSEELQKIDDFVEQALYYSKISNLEDDYIIKELNLEEVVNQAIKKHSKSLIQNRVKITKENLECIINTDGKWMNFILGQIIDNAIKYKREGLELRFEASEEKNRVVLSISDNGVGIDQKDIGKIFIKGFTGENGRKSRKSTGIGLYLCDKLCMKMGLGLSVESLKGEGTTFSISFPKDKRYY